MSNPKEKPILFSAPMVRAILSGQKTQTRRVVKPQPDSFMGENGIEFDMPGWHVCVGPAKFARDFCPYGQPGGQLWVRETWQINHIHYTHSPIPKDHPCPGGIPAELCYLADGTIQEQFPEDCEGAWKWRPSIHMPRWASRITLEITGVRAERLHEISEEDALAEGIQIDRRNTPPFFLGGTHRVKGTPKVFYTARDAFADLWADTYGRASWDANPWVWAVSFRRVA